MTTRPVAPAASMADWIVGYPVSPAIYIRFRVLTGGDTFCAAQEWIRHNIVISAKARNFITGVLSVRYLNSPVPWCQRCDAQGSATFSSEQRSRSC